MLVALSEQRGAAPVIVATAQVRVLVNATGRVAERLLRALVRNDVNR
jgi:hypothetical protein